MLAANNPPSVLWFAKPQFHLTFNSANSLALGDGPRGNSSHFTEKKWEGQQLA